MLNQVPTTIPAEIRDFPEWHHGRETYAVWILQIEGKAVQDKFEAARKHLSGYLLEPYRRQPHITLFVCGFLVDEAKFNDDFTQAQLQNQVWAMRQIYIPSFEIEIGGLNSFASAPFLEVTDPQNGISRLREYLSRGGREFRTAPYTPHLTVGLYAGTFSSNEVAGYLAEFPKKPTSVRVEHITLATYQAMEMAGPLIVKHTLSFNGKYSET